VGELGRGVKVLILLTVALTDLERRIAGIGLVKHGDGCGHPSYLAFQSPSLLAHARTCRCAFSV